MTNRRKQSIEASAQDALENAKMWFHELEEAAITISFSAIPVAEMSATAQTLAIVLPTDTIGRVDKLMERTVYQGCALQVWRRDCRDKNYWAALELVHEAVAEELTRAFLELDDFAPRVLLCEAQTLQGCLELFTDERDIAQLDRVANLTAMRFCELEATFGESANSDAIESCLSIYADCVHDLFSRYGEFRQTLSSPLPSDELASTVGIEALSAKEDFTFLRALWQSPDPPRPPASNRIDVEVSEVDWPPPEDVEDEDETSDESDGRILWGELPVLEDDESETWRDLTQTLAAEREALDEIAAEVGPLTSLATISDEHREQWDERLYPGELGLASAVTALRVLKCRIASLSYGDDDNYPTITFWTPPAYVPLLVECARRAAIGLENAQGTLEAYTTSNEVLTADVSRRDLTVDHYVR